MTKKNEIPSSIRNAAPSSVFRDRRSVEAKYVDYVDWRIRSKKHLDTLMARHKVECFDPRCPIRLRYLRILAEREKKGRNKTNGIQKINYEITPC